MAFSCAFRTYRLNSTELLSSVTVILPLANVNCIIPEKSVSKLFKVT